MMKKDRLAEAEWRLQALMSPKGLRQGDGLFVRKVVAVWPKKKLIKIIYNQQYIYTSQMKQRSERIYSKLLLPNYFL